MCRAVPAELGTDHRHMDSVALSDTVEPNSEQAITIMAIILASPSRDLEAMQASSARGIVHIARRIFSAASVPGVDQSHLLAHHLAGVRREPVYDHVSQGCARDVEQPRVRNTPSFDFLADVEPC